MYTLLKSIHNINRYIVLVLLAVALIRAVTGWLQNRAWTETHRKTNLFTTIFLDIQLLLGLILYFVSPVTLAALQDFGAAMSHALQRQYALEHTLYALLAIVMAHVGSARAKKAASDLLKFRATALYFGAALLLILLGMPWDRWLPF